MGQADLLASASGLINTLIGAGLLAIPHAFAGMGWLLGIVMTLVCAATAEFALVLVHRCCEQVPGGVHSYYELAARTMPGYTWVIDLVIALKVRHTLTQCWGVSISYLLVSGHLLPQVWESALHALGASAPSWMSSQTLWTVLSLLIIAPVCFKRDLHAMKAVGYLNVGAVAYLLLIMTYFAIVPPAGKPRGKIVAVKGGTSVLRLFPIVVFAYTCAQNIISVYAELRNPTRKRALMVTGASMSFTVLVYLFVGLVGYATFGALVSDNIVAMYSDRSLFVGLGKLAVVALTLTSYPVQLHPSRKSLISLLYTPSPAQPVDEQSRLVDEAQRPGRPPAALSARAWNGVTLAMMLAGVVVALLVRDLSLVLGFVGAIGGTAISFMVRAPRSHQLPAVMYWYAVGLTHSASRSARKPSRSCSAVPWPWASYVLVLTQWGALVLVVALAANIAKLVHA